MTATTGTADRCCPEGRALSRRGFLKGMGVVAGAVAAGPAVSTRVSYAATGAATGDVLVVLSLHGGFDGMSVVAPVGDPDYARLRPSIAIPAGTALPTGDRLFGLHPAFAPLLPYWQAGTFGAVHAVGTPDTSRSHFQATEELERAAPGTSLRTGWLDRVVGSRARGSVFQSVQLGSGNAGGPNAGPNPELATRSLKDYTLSQAHWIGPRMATAIQALHTGVEGPAVAAAHTTLASMEAVAAVVAAPRPAATYPDSPLARALADTAQLIRHGAGLETVCLDHGDWDMHADLGRAGTGWMQNQATTLASALAAFAQDLGPLLQRVTVVTLSEFGRRAKENGSAGVDHGHGNAVLLLGGGVVGGRVHGRWPGLSEAALDHGDLAGTTDYRDVLGELLVRRTGLSQGALATAFPGYTPSFLGITRP
jgi:uncharacterized protein (DUF1501 family)